MASKGLKGHVPVNIQPVQSIDPDRFALQMKHAINSDRLPIPPKVAKQIEDCQGVLTDILSWLFGEDVRVVSTTAETTASEIHVEGRFEDLPPDVQERFMEDAVNDKSNFKIVVQLNRHKILTEVMEKLSPEQQAELSAYLMRREYDKHD